MSMPHRLTVVVPTYNRPDILPRALNSLQKQLTPVNVIVADDGDAPEKTREILDELMPEAQHVITECDHAWPNWRAGAEAATSEFVSWLQDDDEVRPSYSTRIIAAFDRFRDADVWMARLLIAIDPRMAYWWYGNGPWVPMDMIEGHPSSWSEGSILVSTSYFTSWSLAPAMAFRNGTKFKRALKETPEHCDIFVERLFPALAADGGPFISDPILAGYWHHHEDHLSSKQHPIQPQMTRIMIPELDRMLDRMDGWKDSLLAWASLVPTDSVLKWMGQVDTTIKEGGKSRYAREVQGILGDSLKGRIKIATGPRRWWRTGMHWLTNQVDWLMYQAGELCQRQQPDTKIL